MSIAFIPDVALGSHEGDGLEVSGVCERGTRSLERRSDRRRVRPSELSARCLLQKAAPARVALGSRAIDPYKQILGQRDHHLRRSRH
jgi:hypothetical protein